MDLFRRFYAYSPRHPLKILDVGDRICSFSPTAGQLGAEGSERSLKHKTFKEPPATRAEVEACIR